jgi:exodeoxyribonuclease-5
MVDKYYSNSWLNITSELVEKGLADDQELSSFYQMLSSPDKENHVLAQEIIKLRIEEAYLEGLNEGQQAAFLGLVKFIRESEGYEGAVLKGYAGTGKTYLISRFVDYITKAYPNRNIAVTAPTNKAVKVLCQGNTFSETNIIKTKHGGNAVRYGTIHSLLGLKQKIGADGTISFVRDKTKSDLRGIKYIIVDEASMLSNELYSLINQYKGNIDVIYMGDPAQIPPINEEYSKPFDVNNPDKLFKLELTEIMRQKGDNPIINRSMHLRDNLTIKDPLMNLGSVKTNDGRILVLDAKTEREHVRPLINKLYNSEQFQKNQDYIKTIAYRNNSVKYLNKVIREELYGIEDSNERFVKNELIIANSPLLDAYGKIIANTSSEFRVIEFQDRIKTFNPQQAKGGLMGKLQKISLNGISIKVKKLDTNSDDDESVLWVVAEEEMERYQSYLNKLKSIAIRGTVKHWIDYYDACNLNHDIDYAYAITAHKSQGSTYENVLFIEEDLSINNKTVEKNRITYTAYTRAKNSLYILK